MYGWRRRLWDCVRRWSLDRRALSDNRTFYQVELRANDHTCRGGIADLDGWGVSRLDYLGAIAGGLVYGLNKKG